MWLQPPSSACPLLPMAGVLLVWAPWSLTLWASPWCSASNRGCPPSPPMPPSHGWEGASPGWGEHKQAQLGFKTRLGLHGLQNPAARSMKGKQLYDGPIVSNCIQTKTDLVTFSWLFWKMCCEGAAQPEWPHVVNPPRKPWLVPAIANEGLAALSVRSASKTGGKGQVY